MSVSNATHAAFVKRVAELTADRGNLFEALTQTRARLAAAQSRLRAAITLADQWDNDADSWDGPAHVDVVAAAHAYAAELRAAIKEQT